MKILLVNPPLTQVNTPYPAICQLTAFLQQQGVEACQIDLGIELIDRLFQKETLEKIFNQIEAYPSLSRSNRHVVQNRAFFETHISSILSFLRGSDLTLSTRFSKVSFWRNVLGKIDYEELEWAYGISGEVDQAKYLATRCIKTLVELIRSTIDPHFELIRYAEQLCLRLPSFDPLEKELNNAPSLIDQLSWQLLDNYINQYNPQWIGFSVTFPGNLYSTLRLAKFVRASYPNIKIVMGGGYVNTELRSITESRLFDYIDFLMFDDGELPLFCLLTHGELIRTVYRKDDVLVWSQKNSTENIPFANLPAPTWKGLKQNLYFDLVETANPMHRLWSVGRWNKMMLAHGCYWAKCSFCDTSLNYIGCFQQAPIQVVVDRMEKMIAETGITGFHFVDEAAPPALLRLLAEEIIRRRLTVSYWTNIRFDKTFTPELAFLMAQSGCIAVSGGLEVASNRLLKLINKGVTLESARECMRNLADNGIMVHAYLMYGFPTETVNELYQSLDNVRQLFKEQLIDSAFWHCYAMTCHSPSGKNPQSVGAKHIDIEQGSFANNEIPFHSSPSIDWSAFHDGLYVATYNYMRGVGLDLPVQKWFDKKR